MGLGWKQVLQNKLAFLRLAHRHSASSGVNDCHRVLVYSAAVQIYWSKKFYGKSHPFFITLWKKCLFSDEPRSSRSSSHRPFFRRAALALFPLEMAEGVNDVLEAVHVVSVDVPVSEVPVGLVLNVPDVRGHDLPGDVLLRPNSLLQHGNLQLAQNLKSDKKLNIPFFLLIGNYLSIFSSTSSIITARRLTKSGAPERCFPRVITGLSRKQ
jgi:hypothetical protein